MRADSGVSALLLASQEVATETGLNSGFADRSLKQAGNLPVARGAERVLLAQNRDRVDTSAAQSCALTLNQEGVVAAGFDHRMCCASGREMIVQELGELHAFLVWDPCNNEIRRGRVAIAIR